MIPFGWIGNALLLTGGWLLAKKWRHAFAFTICGGLCWLHEAWVMGRWDWLFIETAMMLIASRNYYHWINDARSNTSLSGKADSDK